MDRLLDFVFLIYFGSHIPIAVCFDSQAIFPSWMYPKLFVEIMDWFTKSYGDTMMRYKPAWFQSFIYCEMFLQFPFFFIACYAYAKGVSKCQWIRLPIIVYSSHVVTSLLCIYSHVFKHDFSADKQGGPNTLGERLQLATFYFPYFIIPVLLLIDSLFHPIYTKQPIIVPSGRRKVAKIH